MSKLDEILNNLTETAIDYIDPKEAKRQIKDLFDSLIVEQFTDTGEDVAEIRKKIGEL